VSPAPGPRLSPSMIGGPGPAGEGCGRLRRGGSGIRTAGAAGQARIRQEAELSGAQNADRGRPLGDLARGERSFLPLHDEHKLSTRRNIRLWPHLWVHYSPELGSGASVGTYKQGYLLLGCPTQRA
jgi:hypothetical protein